MLPTLLRLVPVLASLGLDLQPVATGIQASITFPSAESPPPGPFRGTLTAYGSGKRVPISGSVVSGPQGARLPVTLEYAAVPEDWAARFRPEGLEYRLRSETGGREWSGSLAWSEIGVTGDRELMKQYVGLRNVEMTQISLFGSQALATLRVKNPFAFPLKLAETGYVLSAEGTRIGSGQTKGRTLHAGRETELQLPLEVDHAALFSAAGRAMGTGGASSVRLEGRLVLRLPGGDVAVPFALSGRLSL